MDEFEKFTELNIVNGSYGEPLFPMFYKILNNMKIRLWCGGYRTDF